MNKFFRIAAFILLMLMQYVASAKTAVSDTIIDDKKPFSNLFLYNKVASNKPYQAQINPRAISFVEEYIRKQGKSLEKMKLWDEIGKIYVPEDKTKRIQRKIYEDENEAVEKQNKQMENKSNSSSKPLTPKNAKCHC